MVAYPKQRKPPPARRALPRPPPTTAGAVPLRAVEPPPLAVLMVLSQQILQRHLGLQRGIRIRLSHGARNAVQFLRPLQLQGEIDVGGVEAGDGGGGGGDWRLLLL